MESISGESQSARSLNRAGGDWELSGHSVNRPPCNAGFGTLEKSGRGWTVAHQQPFLHLHIGTIITE